MSYIGKTLNVTLARTAILALFSVAASCAPALAEGWQHLGAVQHVEKLPDGVELSAGNAKVRITAFREGVIRVRVAPQGAFPKDYSWAVIEAPEVPSGRTEDGKNDVRF